MATLSRHAARPDRSSTTPDREHTSGAAPAHRKPASAPRSRVAFGLGIATVCSLAFVNLLAGEPATATVEPSASVAVATALGIEGAGVEQPAAEDAEALGQLAASRAQRDEQEAAAAASQAEAEGAAAEAKAAAERAAAEAAARAAAEAAAAEAAAQAAAEADEAQPAEAAAAAAQAAEAAPTAEAAAPADQAPPAAGTAVSAVAQISNSAGAIRPEAQNAADAVVSNVPGAAGVTIGGTRPSAADPGGHPSGLALDYMVMSNAGLGDAIVAYHVANWDRLGVDYIIWQQRMLSSPGGSWSYMADRGSPTANHMDHPHVNYRG